MRLDSHFVYALLSLFCRCTTMLISSPVPGQSVPVKIRVLLGLVFSFCLLPVVQHLVPPVPVDMASFALSVCRDVSIGLLIGGFLQLLVASAQVAGAFMDVQIGTGSAQIFNPYLGAAATPVAQFKMMLTVLLVFLLNGHRMMISAFAQSYAMPGPNLASVQAQFLAFISQTAMLSLQIAAPVAGVTIVIDMAAGIVNKAVPQTQPFLISLPAKLAAGMVAMAVGLPALATAVDFGLDTAFDKIGHVLQGR